MAQKRIDEFLAETSTPDTSLCEFFEDCLPQLNNINLRDIPFKVLDDIALTIHSTRRRETDWMAFVNELGISDNRAICYINFKSKWREELPIYIALTGPLQERLTFGNLIEVIIKNKRHDVLLDLKPFVKRLLNNSISYSYIAKEPTAPEAQELEKETEGYSSQKLNEKYQGDHHNESHMTINGKGNEKSIDCNRVILNTETITILILHADEDTDIAENLCSMLRRAGISAKTLSQFDHLLMMNSFEVIPALISVVDFVVPIVSEPFLRQIHSRNHQLLYAFDNVDPYTFDDSNYADNFSHNSNNHYIYQMILNQYMQNRCLNFNVRPVMVPGFNRRRLLLEVLLRQSYKLWEKVPDFIEMLRNTKQLLNRMRRN